MTFTASGARRMGDEYQDLQSAEVLIEWLEQPSTYRWVRLETMDGSLDDIQAERADGTRRLLQVKFTTDASIEWDWDALTKQESGKTGPKPSLLQKWKTSFDDVLAKGLTVSEAALLTNRAASADIRAHLSDSGLIEFNALTSLLQATISRQLGGAASAASFFASFHFFFRERSYEALEVALRERFRRLGGKTEGWTSLMMHIRRWINRQDEPSADGTITLAHVREAALWHLPPRIPQGFLVPRDFVVPEAWSETVVEAQLRAANERVLVVTGRPGAGKSTYLSWLVDHLRDSGIPVVRHHFFLSATDETPNRTDWETAANSIIEQLIASYPDLVRNTTRQNPLPDTLPLFLSEAGDGRKGIDSVVVIIDGLDHVWRDTGNAERLRLLFERLLPPPEGIVVIVGTQDVDVLQLPKKLRDTCPREKWQEIPLLDWERVHEWLHWHKDELGLPEDQQLSDRLLDELTDAFQQMSGGHPLVLHYTLAAVRQSEASTRPDQVRELPKFDPDSSVATYYRALWESITPEGHHLLHLLAGFPWSWPRDGLVQCLAPHTDLARVERAERAIRHVLGTSHTGVTAFHESLLAFVRAMPDHQSAARTLRPQVVNWLTQGAPEYWRWRYEWEELAKSGNTEPLICTASLDWCINSLVAGRGRIEIANVVAASGWAALKAGRLGVTTERHYIDSYLNEASHAEGVLSKLVWIALHLCLPASRELELKLFLSRVTQATEGEIEAAAEVSFSFGYQDVCEELLNECAERWDTTMERVARAKDKVSSLKRTLPFLIAANLTDPSEGSYQRHVSSNNADPAWCLHGQYVKALARYCSVGYDTHAIREELSFLANRTNKVSLSAVDEIVRIGCRDGFNPDSWFTEPESRRSGMFRCYRRWVAHSQDLPPETPVEVSFLPLLEIRYGQNESSFAELARLYFFSCLAASAEGRISANAVGLDVKATKVAEFLSILRNLAQEAATAKNAGQTLGGKWFITRLSTIRQIDVRSNDLDNQQMRGSRVPKSVIAIAQDLEELHFAEFGMVTLTHDVIQAAIDGPWSEAGAWIEDHVERRLKMRDLGAAQLLIDRERARLERGRDYLHTRAEEYATLAQFCQIHGRPVNDVKSLAALAARNLLGHGFRKDTVLSDMLDGISCASGETKSKTMARLAAISSVVQIIEDITDGAGTSHLKETFAKMIRKVAPESLPSYVRALQANSQHWDVESIFTDLAKSVPFDTAYDRAVALTLIHEDALASMQERAGRGDKEAGLALASTLAYYGRQMATSSESQTNATATALPETDSEATNVPAVEDYPPARLAEFVAAVRSAHIYGDKNLAEWTTYWRAKEPVELLSALKQHRETTGHPLERQTGELVVGLALERSGLQAAWEWMVAYHQVGYGWSWYGNPLSDVDWIWKLVLARFKGRWLEFIVATSRPLWGSAAGAPAWSIKRMILFLSLVGEGERIGEVLDAAVGWGAGLAADMRLPEPALTPDIPELPVSLRLLLDRLDCPSRMVQERAAWSLAALLADVETREDAAIALLAWHTMVPLELRSCQFLLVLCLAHSAHGSSVSDCLSIARTANLLPSIGVSVLLHEFGDEGAIFAASLGFQTRHSGRPTPEFSPHNDFEKIVKGHLAPAFMRWSRSLDAKGIPFSGQWEWEAVNLARQVGTSLGVDMLLERYRRSGVYGPTLAISDRLSVVLRSAYLRALHWSLDAAGLDSDLAEIHARRVAAMADPSAWAVRPCRSPDWWPVDQSDSGRLDMLGEAVGLAIKNRLETRNPDEEDILLYAAGPVGNRPDFRAEVVIKSFLQSAYGPMKPRQEELADALFVGCRSIPPRLSLSGSYMTFAEDYGFLLRDWMVAPLAWQLDSDSVDWLLPDRDLRGIYLPATWLLPGAPTITTESEQVRVLLGDQPVARFRYWLDDLHERSYPGSFSRVGVELLGHRQWLAPHLAAGATLCWIATLSIAQRGEYENQFGEARVVGSWLVGGSRWVWPKPWQPPRPKV